MKALVPLFCACLVCVAMWLLCHVRCPHCILSAGQESKQLVEESNAVERVDTQSGTSPGVEEGAHSPTAVENKGRILVT